MKEGGSFTLPCKNETPGSFFGIIWKAKDELYEYLSDTGLNIDPSIVKRSELVKGTNLKIYKARRSDEGNYECNLLFHDKSIGFPRVMVQSIIKVIVVCKYILLSPK